MRAYLIIAVASALLVIFWQLAYLTDNRLRVHVLDVGQGDSILIEIPGETTILMDGGPGDYVLVEMAEALPPWVRRIDTIVLTHPHADHLEGLLDVIERFDVGTAIFNPVWYKNGTYQYFLEQLEKMEIRVQYLDRFGYKIESYSGVQIGFFAEYWVTCGDELSVCIAEKTDCGECLLSLNNSSIVSAVEYSGTMILLMGDTEEEVETELASMTFSVMGHPDSIILKAGHHCSRTASSDEFLRRVDPDIAICSLGEGNSFGHPHSETIDRFYSYEVPYLRTDKEGSIVIEISANGWKIR